MYWQGVEEFDGSWLLLRLKALENAAWDTQPQKKFLPSDASCEQAHRLIILSGPIDVSLERLEPNRVTSRKLFDSVREDVLEEETPSVQGVGTGL